MENENPFAAPTTTTDDDPNRVVSDSGLPLAGRFTRLIAGIVDGIVMIIVGLPVNYFLYGDFYSAIFDPSLSPIERQQAIEAFQPGLAVTAIGFVAGIALYLLVNGYWIAKDGQTVGKKVLGIRMVRADGSRASLVRLVGLRAVPFWLISMIPILGGLMIIVDCLLIFRRSRRTLHDQVADTIVVKAS